MPLSSRFVNTFFSVSAGLVGILALVFGSCAVYWHYAAKVPASPIVLFASHDSGVGGTTLVFRADGTFRYENAAFIASDVVTGHYTRTGRLIRLDRLPTTGLLQRRTLVVRPALASETGRGLWQAAHSGRVDSTVVLFTIFPAK